MTTMLTATGARVNLLAIEPATISALDIAHHLAQINRFTGACKRPYSVAEHSLLVVEIIEREAGVHDPAILMAALLHDAHEAYVNDVSRPSKQALGSGWKAFEEGVQWPVLRRFRVADVFRNNHHLIKWADDTALSTERAALMPPSPDTWTVSISNPAVAWCDIERRGDLTWLDWRRGFLDKFDELQYARSLRQDRRHAA